MITSFNNPPQTVKVYDIKTIAKRYIPIPGQDNVVQSILFYFIYYFLKISNIKKREIKLMT